MSFWDFTRSPASARLLVDFGDERGVPHTTLLAGTGLADAQLDDPKVEVTAAQELRLTGNLLRALGRGGGGGGGGGGGRASGSRSAGAITSPRTGCGATG